VGKLKHGVWITCVHLEDLHCLLANFPGLICHYLVSKIKIKIKIKRIFFLNISYNFILRFYLQVLFVILVLGLVFACIYVVVV
jgi:hypothetical protein